MSGSFYDQLDGVAGVFEQWGECERTVMAVTLARRVPWPGLRLLQRAVEEALARAAPAPDAPIANEEPAVASLLASAAGDDDDEGDSSLQKLVELLPLLRSDNTRVKDAYVGAAPALVQRCVDAPRRSAAAPLLCRQLLCYLLVHPALTRGDVRSLTQWLHYLENHMSGNRSSETVWQKRIEPCLVPENIWGSTSTFRRTIGKNVEFRSVVDSVDYNSDLLQESFSKNGRDVDLCNETEKLNFDATISQPKPQRSNSLTPPSSNFMSSSAENLSDELFVQKPRSFSLSSEHSLQIRPLMMYSTTGGSETRLDDLRTNNFTEHRGMSTVAQWLKSLRLHKYVWLFTNISYDQMMAMDDKHLEKLGVTKGARHKILVSIRKLADRAHVVGGVEAELMAGATGATAARALERLRTALLGPMPPDSPLPQAIVQVLHLASKCLNVGGGASVVRGAGAGDAEVDAPDPLSLHCWLVEKALHHEAFSRPDLVEALKRLRHRLPPRQFYRHVGDLPHRHRPKPRWRPGPPQKRWSLGGVHAMPPPQPRPKSHSYPPYPPPPSRHPPGDPAEDYSSLDALCLQMTEQAIN